MSKEELKKSLLLRRPWVKETAAEKNEIAASEANEPEMIEFRARAESFNARVHRELVEIPVPPTLRDQILARRNIIAVPFWRRQSAWIGLAAALVLIVTGVVFYARPPREDNTFAGFRARMASFVLRQYRMDVLTSDLGKLEAYLAQTGSPADIPLPPTLRTVPLKGGASLKWQGHPVSMVCFDWKGKQTLFMFVLEDAGVSGRPSRNSKVELYKQLSTATWTADGKSFLLFGRIPADDLKALVTS